MPTFTPQEISKLQAYLQEKFQNKNITAKVREKATDSLEILISGEFLGTVYKDQDDGETSYDLNIAILDTDLDE